MESIPGSHKHLKIRAQEGTEGGGEKGGLRGGRGDRGGDDLCPGIWGAYVHQMFHKIQNNTLSSLFRAGGVCIFLEIDRAFEFDFGKLLGEIEFEFLRNSKYLVEFEDRAGSRKKRLGEAEASPSIHALIHRSLVSPTALVSASYKMWYNSF